MVKLNEKFVTDAQGRTTEVILPHRDFRRLLQYLEDLEDRLEIKRRRQRSEFVPWTRVKAELSGRRGA